MAIDTRMIASRSAARASINRRPFRLLDAMILTAATAIACGFFEWISRATDGGLSWVSLARESLKPFQAASLHGSTARDWIDLLFRADPHSSPARHAFCRDVDAGADPDPIARPATPIPSAGASRG